MRFLLIFLLAATVHATAGAQVFECNTLGFKFVIDCECHYWETDPSYHKTYRNNPVPMITYITEGSPLTPAGIAVGAKLFMIGTDSTCGRTGDEILLMLNRTPSGKVQLVYDKDIQCRYHDSVTVVFPKTDFTFPKPTGSPVAGTPLLGTVTASYDDTKRKAVLYENGDTYVGQVKHEVYPDLRDKKPDYESHQAKMERWTAFEANYIHSLEVAEQAKKQAAEEQKKKLAQDTLSTAEIIKGFTPSGNESKWILGVGVELQPYYEGANRFWQISHITPGGSAWFNGLDSGDVIVYVRPDPASDHEISSKTLSKPELVALLTGTAGDSVVVTFSQVYSYAFFQEKKLWFTTLLNGTESSMSGCLSGNCTDGNGSWMDAKGNLYVGAFRDGVISGNGKEYSAVGNYVYQGPFSAGKKEGSGTAQLGKGTHKRDHFICQRYTGPYVNDLRQGSGHINAYDSINYDVEYKYNKLTRIQIAYNNGDYCTCDTASPHEIRNCYNKQGSTIPHNTAGGKREIPTICTYDPSKDPNRDKTVPEQADILPVLTRIGHKIDSLFTDGKKKDRDGSFVIHKSTTAEQTTLTFKVPPHTSIDVYFFMQDQDLDRVCYEFTGITYSTPPSIGAAGDKLGTAVGRYWMTVVYADNDRDVEGEFTVKVSGFISSKYSTRTIYYMSALTPR